MKKGDFFILHFLSSSSSLSTVAIIGITIAAAGYAVENDAIDDAAEAEDRTAIAGEARQAAAICIVDRKELTVATVARRSTGAAIDDDDAVPIVDTTAVGHNIRVVHR